MANLFSSLFKQIEKPQSVHPPSASPALSISLLNIPQMATG